MTYPAEMQKSIVKVEASRSRRMGVSFPKFDSDEKSALLETYHPDFNLSHKRPLRIGANKGDTVPKELAELLESPSRIKPGSIDLNKVDYTTDILVIGGGVAGVEAALVLSNQPRTIYLVEKSPCIGGAVAKFEEVCPTLECSPCMVAAKLQEVLSKPNIKVLTNSEVTEVLGSIGNFIGTINQKARYVDLENCIGCGACYEVCPVDVENEYNEGIGTRKAIFIPYAGALPNVPVIDTNHCLQLKGGDCTACQEACAFDAIKYDDGDTTHFVSDNPIAIGAAGKTVTDSVEVRGLARVGISTDTTFIRATSVKTDSLLGKIDTTETDFTTYVANHSGTLTGYFENSCHAYWSGGSGVLSPTNLEYRSGATEDHLVGAFSVPLEFNNSSVVFDTVKIEYYLQGSEDSVKIYFAEADDGALTYKDSTAWLTGSSGWADINVLTNGDYTAVDNKGYCLYLHTKSNGANDVKCSWDIRVIWHK